MRFSKALPILFSELQKRRIDHALVGGLALYTLGSSRSTFDADFLILLSQADDVDVLMKSIGYDLLERTAETSHYGSRNPDMGQVDFLFAHRSYALAMLQRATDNKLLGHPIRVIRPEDLIGLKVQSSSNDPNRADKDLADIQEVMLRHGKTMDWNLIADYFRIFKREKELDQLKKRFA